MSKILNGHNFVSVYAMNTKLTSLCCACDGEGRGEKGVWNNY